MILGSACEPGPCSEDIAIPADCAIDDDGDPVEDECFVDGDESWPRSTQTCGRAELKYQLELCAIDPNAVDDEVIASITCDRIDED